jgi:hypothetical protein
MEALMAIDDDIPGTEETSNDEGENNRNGKGSSNDLSTQGSIQRTASKDSTIISDVAGNDQISETKNKISLDDDEIEDIDIGLDVDDFDAAAAGAYEFHDDDDDDDDLEDLENFLTKKS